MLEVPELVVVAGNSGWAGLVAINAQRIDLALVGAAVADKTGGDVAPRARSGRNGLAQRAAVIFLERCGWNRRPALHDQIGERSARAGAVRALNSRDGLVWPAKLTPVADLPAENLLDLLGRQVGNLGGHVGVDNHRKDHDGDLIILKISIPRGVDILVKQVGITNLRRAGLNITQPLTAAASVDCDIRARIGCLIFSCSLFHQRLKGT